MECPKCHGAMETVTFKSIAVQRCKNCGGIWFEALQQEHLRAMRGAEAIDTGDVKVGQQMDELQHVPCPVCHEPMLRLTDVDHPHLHFESCPVCYGSFFDAGKFRQYKSHGILEYIHDLLQRPG